MHGSLPAWNMPRHLLRCERGLVGVLLPQRLLALAQQPRQRPPRLLAPPPTIPPTMVRLATSKAVGRSSSLRVKGKSKDGGEHLRQAHVVGAVALHGVRGCRRVQRLFERAPVGQHRLHILVRRAHQLLPHKFANRRQSLAPCKPGNCTRCPLWRMQGFSELSAHAGPVEFQSH